jgi:hypothetical protein
LQWPSYTFFCACDIELIVGVEIDVAGEHDGVERRAARSARTALTGFPQSVTPECLGY